MRLRRFLGGTSGGGGGGGGASADSRYIFARFNTPQSIADNTPVELSFDNVFELGTEHDVHLKAGDATSIEWLKAGLYGISVLVNYAANATGNRDLSIGASWAGALAGELNVPAAAATGETRLSVSGFARVDVGDTMQVNVFQTSGGALDVSSAEVQITRITD